MSRGAGEQAIKAATARSFITASALDALLLFGGLFVLYVANGGLMILADSVSNSYLPLSVLNDGNLSITPDECPFLFAWELKGPQETTTLGITQITPEVDSLRTEGLLQAGQWNYNLVPTSRTGLFVSQFGPGAGLTALPAVAIVQLVAGDLRDQRWLLAAVCRAVAAACVAGSAVLVYLTARRFVSRGSSLALAVAYGIGTCVWTTSSQSLVQHGPNELYLALGTYALARGIGSWRWLVLAGLAYSAAVVCRPTSGVVVLLVGAYLLATDRRGWLAYAAGCLPLLLLLAAYNYYYFGNPLTFGQTVQASLYLDRETGSTNAWTTPLFTGLAGLLISPSRGLLVYSPWLILPLAGAVAVWRRREYGWLRPLTVAVVAIAVVQAKWFSWWGGWSYGTRPLVDTMPMCALFALPTVEWLRRNQILQAVLAPLVVWSVFVQALGALAYDMEGWNARRGFAVQSAGRGEPYYTVSREEADELAELSGGRVAPAVLNIDFAPHTDRLWSLADNQIGYYLTHFGEARAERRRVTQEGTWIVGRNPALTHYNLGVGLAALGRVDEAVTEYRAAIAASPNFDAAYLNLGNIYAQRRLFDEATAAYEQAIRIAPDSVAARENLAHVLADQGRYVEAIEQYRKCLDLDNNSARTHFLYAESLAAQGGDARAVDEYREAIRLNPQWGEARRSLAWVLATSPDADVRDPRDAWGLARELLAATNSQDPRVLDTAAAAAAAIGRFDEAIRVAELALKLPAVSKDSALEAGILGRLELYRRQQPFVRSQAVAR